MAFTWTLTNAMSTEQQSQVNEVLGTAVQASLDIAYTAIMAVFNFFTQPAVLGVVVTIGLIIWAYQIIKRKIIRRAG